jgi:predicted ABC-type ATPase
VADVVPTAASTSWPAPTAPARAASPAPCSWPPAWVLQPGPGRAAGPGRHPGASQTDANGAAWAAGKRLLERAIAERLTFAFETTLGGRTMTALLERAMSTGLEVRIWYVGLASPELHLARVRARVAKGGHDIPAVQVRARYDSSRLNLIRLLPRLTELRVYDNSAEADPRAGVAPSPELILHMVRGKVVESCALGRAPGWAKPILAAAAHAAPEARRS